MPLETGSYQWDRTRYDECNYACSSFCWERFLAERFRVEEPLN